jgi:hypothetical protein
MKADRVRSGMGRELPWVSRRPLLRRCVCRLLDGSGSCKPLTSARSRRRRVGPEPNEAPAKPALVPRTSGASKLSADRIPAVAGRMRGAGGAPAQHRRARDRLGALGIPPGEVARDSFVRVDAARSWWVASQIRWTGCCEDSTSRLSAASRSLPTEAEISAMRRSRCAGSGRWAPLSHRDTQPWETPNARPPRIA